MIRLANIDSKISFKQFLEVVKADVRSDDTEKEMIRYFQVFDETSCGTIKVDLLKSCLKSMGEAMSDAEFSEFTKLIKPNTKGEVDYRSYCALLFKKASY